MDKQIITPATIENVRLLFKTVFVGYRERDIPKMFGSIKHAFEAVGMMEIDHDDELADVVEHFDNFIDVFDDMCATYHKNGKLDAFLDERSRYCDWAMTLGIKLGEALMLTESLTYEIDRLHLSAKPAMEILSEFHLAESALSKIFPKFCLCIQQAKNSHCVKIAIAGFLETLLVRAADFESQEPDMENDKDPIFPDMENDKDPIFIE